MADVKSSQLQVFAEQVLYGTTLAEKLAPPPSDIFEGADGFAIHPGFLPPKTPGRPQSLDMPIESAKKSAHSFPTRSTLTDDRARGMVLHFFANHELLAMELMAVAILKFHDAPQGFIKGIVQTIADEQQHMKLYMNRMTQLGVEFGEAGLNGFFWKSLKDMATPQEYVAAMSLTFEQANLDFSWHYENEFARLGDQETATILKKVRLDEIGHVKHGAIWLERWRDPAKTLWQEYLEHLRYPMTPMRAKGPVFDHEGRKAAGLSDEFSREVELFSASRGRPPKVYWFNPMCEQEVHAKAKFTPPRPIADMTDDLAPLMMYLAHTDDVVVVHEKPTKDWIASMKAAGFEIPELCEGLQNPASTVKGRKIATPMPWGWSASASHHFTPLFKSMVDGFATPPSELWQEANTSKNIFSKTFAAALRGPEDLKGTIVRTYPDLLNAVAQHSQDGTLPFVIKAPFGSSGRNALVSTKNQPLDLRETAWCQRHLEKDQELLVEPWVSRVDDLSCQFEVSKDGDFRIHGFTRFLVNDRGQYRGHLLGKMFEGLPAEIAASWHEPVHGWKCRFEETARRVGKALVQSGYHGPVGIDGFIYRRGDQFEFQSLSEINPRFTMGRVALGISKHVITKTPGVWLHLTKTDIKAAGHVSFQEFSEKLQHLSPLGLRVQSSGVRLLDSGSICTNDPALAKQTLTVLVLADTFLQIKDTLTGLNLHDIKLPTTTDRGSECAPQ